MITACKVQSSTTPKISFKQCSYFNLCAGKLYSQLGLVYTSMGLFDLGIQNFERALPLVRERTRSDDHLQAEASLLQNIGAAYNEKALFSDAVVYHKEAAAIHGERISTVYNSRGLL